MRAIAEADIVQLDAERNWLTRSRSPASSPSSTRRSGQTTLHGTPFEMPAGALLVLANQAVLGDGALASTYGDVRDATRSALLRLRLAQRDAVVPNASVAIGECVTRTAAVPPATVVQTPVGGDFGDDVVERSCY